MKLKRGDMILIAVVLIGALIFMVPRFFAGDDSGKLQNMNTFAKISVDGKPFKTVELTQEEQFIEVKTDRGYNKLRIHDHGIEMAEADCPDEVCFTFGHITKPGQTIVCLPNRVLVEIIGKTKGDDLDAVVK
ncbi:NusG domain II-containing protein [Paenibacillus sp. KN14-4R]|uniref:NusG domain II-containing protein n=1 Tax=Paenibacillus sp. KN14-4R TaxID=3445773 RepID=UPI003F9F1EAB